MQRSCRAAARELPRKGDDLVAALLIIRVDDLFCRDLDRQASVSADLGRQNAHLIFVSIEIASQLADPDCANDVSRRKPERDNQNFHVRSRVEPEASLRGGFEPVLAPSMLIVELGLPNGAIFDIRPHSLHPVDLVAEVTKRSTTTTRSRICGYSAGIMTILLSSPEIYHNPHQRVAVAEILRSRSTSGDFVVTAAA